MLRYFFSHSQVYLEEKKQTQRKQRCWLDCLIALSVYGNTFSPACEKGFIIIKTNLGYMTRLFYIKHLNFRTHILFLHDYQISVHYM